MNDKELLELAALAAGLHIDKSRFNGGGLGNTGFDISGNAVLNWHNSVKWNPLKSDADALRLAVKTGVLEGRGFDNQWNALYAIGKLPKDRYEAYRLCITRAAAEIGRKMKELK